MMLPNVEPTVFHIEHSQIYYLDEGVKYRVANAAVIANGTRDLCICIDKDGQPTINKIVDVSSEKVLYTPKTDLVWLAFEKPIRGTQWSMICEMSPEIKRIVDHLISLDPKEVEKGKDFEMYAGEDYGV